MTVRPVTPADYERAAQLAQRTNQFNNTGVRWTAANLGPLLESGARRALTVRARDWFGDYGEVGLVVFRAENAALVVDTFLMSCRVLGKGAEHRVMAVLAQEAERQSVADIVIPFVELERNQPIQKFLTSTGAQQRPDGAFVLPASAASHLELKPDDEETPPAEAGPSASVVASRPDFVAISQLDSAEKIQRAVQHQSRRARPQLANEFVPPATASEIRLAAIWEDVLRVSPIGVTDSFLSLGGKSLQAAGVVSRIATEFGVRVGLSALLSNPTIAELLETIRTAPPADGAGLQESGDLTLSASQQRLWFLDQFIPNRAAYNIPIGRKIRGRVDRGALQAALSLVVDRHPLLRSTYESEEESRGGPRCAQVARLVRIHTGAERERRDRVGERRSSAHVRPGSRSAAARRADLVRSRRSPAGSESPSHRR